MPEVVPFPEPYAAASLAYFKSTGLQVPSRIQPAELRLWICEQAEHWRPSHPLIGARLDTVAANLEAAILAKG